MARELVDYFVLDALADDIESLEDILRIMNSDGLGWRDLHPKPFAEPEVIPALLRGMKDRTIEALAHSDDGLVPMGEGVLPTQPLGDLWFRLTPGGRMVHSAWEPPASAEAPPNKRLKLAARVD